MPLAATAEIEIFPRPNYCSPGHVAQRLHLFSVKLTFFLNLMSVFIALDLSLNLN